MSNPSSNNDALDVEEELDIDQTSDDDTSDAIDDVILDMPPNTVLGKWYVLNKMVASRGEITDQETEHNNQTADNLIVCGPFNSQTGAEQYIAQHKNKHTGAYLRTEFGFAR